MVGTNGNIARVWVAVEESMAQELREVALPGTSRQFVSVNSHGLDFFDPVNFDARDVFHGEDAGSRAVPIYFGNLDPNSIFKVSSKPICALSFPNVIDLFVQKAGGFVVNCAPVAGSAVLLGVKLVQQLGQDAEILKVDVEEVLEALSLDLDGYLTTVDHGAMNLSKRGGGNGDRIKGVENVFDGFAEILLDDLDGAFTAKAWDTVLEDGEFLDVLLGEDIDSGGKKLTQLNKGGAES
mmetsp:Transcript_54044/g.132506  ORF Transcript_54044/g.132506 Transcript_54044/m.132506 type:complete len:238 (+) Transcript_54044:915-1628(+)